MMFPTKYFTGAEGAADRTRQQFSNFLSNAIGSLNEIDTQLELAV
jgi:four helix bundle protein